MKNMNDDDGNNDNNDKNNDNNDTRNIRNDNELCNWYENYTFHICFTIIILFLS